MIGRLAPSPTGAQHIGNARTYLLAWWQARHSDGKIWLRIEDLETPRVKPWAVTQIYDDFQRLGIDYDASPQKPLSHLPPLVQSHRGHRYREVLKMLLEKELVYPCTCTRSEVASAAAAPHEGSELGREPVYAGTCRDRDAADYHRLVRQGTECNLRFRMPERSLRFNDLFFGENEIADAARLGDFVIWRKEDAAAYQLAVVVDDHDAGVDHVLRGNDLILSTFRQKSIHEALNWPLPQYTHVPLVVGPDGRRLAKRHGDTRLATLWQAGIHPEQLIGWLAYRSGWIERTQPLSARELLPIDNVLERTRREPLTFWAERDLEEMSRL